MPCLMHPIYFYARILWVRTVEGDLKNIAGDEANINYKLLPVGVAIIPPRH